MDAIRARQESGIETSERLPYLATVYGGADTAFIVHARTDIPALLAYIDELERRTAYTVGETEWAHRIATLEHMLAEERENVDTLRARVAELEAEVAILRPWSVMLKRAHGALTDAGCVVPLEFDQSIEHAINDLARRATRAEQLFVDEYDARKAAEREIAELKARLPVDGSNMPSIVDALEDDNAALRAEIAELKARITTLEAMKP